MIGHSDARIQVERHLKKDVMVIMNKERIHRPVIMDDWLIWLELDQNWMLMCYAYLKKDINMTSKARCFFYKLYEALLTFELLDNYRKMNKFLRYFLTSTKQFMKFENILNSEINFYQLIYLK